MPPSTWAAGDIRKTWIAHPGLSLRCFSSPTLDPRPIPYLRMRRATQSYPPRNTTMWPTPLFFGISSISRHLHPCVASQPAIGPRCALCGRFPSGMISKESPWTWLVQWNGSISLQPQIITSGRAGEKMCLRMCRLRKTDSSLPMMSRKKVRKRIWNSEWRKSGYGESVWQNLS